MTGRLGDALRAVAETVPPAVVPDGLFDRGRRRRRRSTALAAAAVVALVLAGVGVLPGLLSGSRAPVAGPGRAGPGLPTRLHVPPLRTSTVGLSAPGAAAAIFGGPATRNGWDEGRFAVVAADDDRYRVMNEAEVYTAPGFEALLSPDGRFLARHNELHSLTGARAPRAFFGEPLAFSPSGALLVATTVASVGGPADVSDDVEVHRLDGAAAPARIPTGAELPERGWTAAVSPDDAIVALQVGDEVRLVRPRFGATAVPYRRLPLDGGRLAGPASWEPGGTGVVVAHPQGSGWRLSTRDASTGRPVPGPAFPDLPGTGYVRIVAWRSPDTAVALLGVRDTGTVRVVALRRGAAAPDPVLETPPGVSDLDVASDLAAAGAVRPAGEPSYGPPRPLFLVPGLVLLAVAAVVTSLVVHAARQRATIRRHLRSAPGRRGPPPPPSAPLTRRR